MGRRPENNVGVRLENGHLELRIKAGDDAFAHAFFLAAEHLRIDARAAFGVERISSVILNVEDQELIEPWAPRWPKGFKDKHGHWTETTVRTSSMPTKCAKAIYRFSKPLPGSITPDGVVVWRPKGKAAALDVDIGIEDLEPRPLAPTGMDVLIRALAYATLAVWVRAYLDGLTDWDASLTRMLGGWIARVEVEGRGINAKGKSLEGICWCPIDTREAALDLIDVPRQAGRERRSPSRLSAGRGPADPRSARACRGLDRDRRLVRAGWQAGDSASVPRRPRPRRHRAHERTLYLRHFDPTITSTASGFSKGCPTRHARRLVREYDNQGMFVGKKRLNPFRLYATSELRTDVADSGHVSRRRASRDPPHIRPSMDC